MNRKIRKMVKVIERRGGVVRWNESLPAEVMEQFLADVLACPDCCAASAGPLVGQPIDQVLAGTLVKGNATTDIATAIHVRCRR